MAAVIVRPENLAPLIFLIRGEKVLLDADLAALYGVTPKALNQAMKRNRERFPADFCFQLTAKEWADLRAARAQVSGGESNVPNWSQFVTSSKRHRGAAYRPYAFTEQGVAMLSSVLRSPRAVEVNIAIMRTFVQLRRLMDSNRDLARKIEAMEKKYDEQFGVVFEAIKQLVAEDDARKAQPPNAEFSKRTKGQLATLFTAARDETAAQTAAIEKVEAEINARVAALYGL